MKMHSLDQKLRSITDPQTEYSDLSIDKLADNIVRIAYLQLDHTDTSYSTLFKPHTFFARVAFETLVEKLMEQDITPDNIKILSVLNDFSRCTDRVDWIQQKDITNVLCHWLKNKNQIPDEIYASFGPKQSNRQDYKSFWFNLLTELSLTNPIYVKDLLHQANENIEHNNYTVNDLHIVQKYANEDMCWVQLSKNALLLHSNIYHYFGEAHTLPKQIKSIANQFHINEAVSALTYVIKVIGNKVNNNPSFRDLHTLMRNGGQLLQYYGLHELVKPTFNYLVQKYPMLETHHIFCAQYPDHFLAEELRSIEYHPTLTLFQILELNSPLALEIWSQQYATADSIPIDVTML